jgi:hypothetical protein
MKKYIDAANKTPPRGSSVRKVGCEILRMFVFR